MDRHYDQAWSDGIDRWFGQTMTSQQLNIIHDYSMNTHKCDMPQWVYGLRFINPGSEPRLCGRYLQWDYGLSLDLQLLRHHRGGAMPFEFMPHLWTLLHVRWETLGTTMNDTPMHCLEETIT